MVQLKILNHRSNNLNTYNLIKILIKLLVYDDSCTWKKKIELIKITKYMIFIRYKSWYFNGFKLDSRTKLLINSNIKLEKIGYNFLLKSWNKIFKEKMNLDTFYFKIESSESVFK